MQNPNWDNINYLPVEKLETLHAMTDDELRTCAHESLRGNLPYASSICPNCGVVSTGPDGDARTALTVECDACILRRVKRG